MTPERNVRIEGRFQADQRELAERIAQAQPIEGRIEAQAGLYLNRFSVAGSLSYSVLEPSFCVIAQGSKDVLVGGERLRYDQANYLIATMGLPAVGQVVEATPERPYLGFRLVLDPGVVMSVMLETDAVDPQHESGGIRAIAVSPLDVALLDATLRLVRLLEEPSDYQALAPLIEREIVYRLLKGAQGARLRHLTTFGGRGHRMARAVEMLRRSFTQQLRIGDLASELNMSVSGFHAHFKAATAMTPLQFQKELRLQEARRRMLSEEKGAAEAGFEVGYDDASHFNRDYKRHFGEPPLRDIQRLKESATASL